MGLVSVYIEFMNISFLMRRRKSYNSILGYVVMMLFGLKEKSSVSGLLTEVFTVSMLAAPPRSNLS